MLHDKYIHKYRNTQVEQQDFLLIHLYWWSQLFATGQIVITVTTKIAAIELPGAVQSFAQSIEPTESGVFPIKHGSKRPMCKYQPWIVEGA